MPLRDDLLAPIPGNSPAGISLRYDPITDKIKEARREDLDAPQGAWKTAIKSADHAQAIKLASDAIAEGAAFLAGEGRSDGCGQRLVRVFQFGLSSGERSGDLADGLV